MTPKENLLEAIRFGKPDYMPRHDEEILYYFSFDGICRRTSWTDPWGVGWEDGGNGTVPFPTRHPLADLAKLDGYAFPDPDALQLPDGEREKLEKLDRDRHIPMGEMSYLLFERAWALMGMDNFFMALIDAPEACKTLLHHIAEYAKRVFTRYVALGAECITFSEDLGSQRGPMMSDEMFLTFFLPEYQFIFEDFLREGILVNFHSCGNVTSIAGHLAGIGISILNPIQGKANDLAKIKRDTFGKTALRGGVDSATVLLGTPEEVRRETARVIEILKPGGGYICGPDQWLPNFPPENVAALYGTARELGAYQW